MWVDKVETTIPGVIVASHGDRGGRIAYVPWDVGGLYYRQSSQGHAGLMTDLIDHLLPRSRQLTTSAHPLVEITVMRQPAKWRTLVHLVNLSGHSDTAYFDPLPMRDISIDLASIGIGLGAGLTPARAMVAGQRLPVTRTGGRSRFLLPRSGPTKSSCSTTRWLVLSCPTGPMGPTGPAFTFSNGRVDSSRARSTSHLKGPRVTGEPVIHNRRLNGHAESYRF